MLDGSCFVNTIDYLIKTFHSFRQKVPALLHFFKTVSEVAIFFFGKSAELVFLVSSSFGQESSDLKA